MGQYRKGTIMTDEEEKKSISSENTDWKIDQVERKRIIGESIAALSAKGWGVSIRKEKDDRR